MTPKELQKRIDEKAKTIGKIDWGDKRLQQLWERSRYLSRKHGTKFNII